MLGAFSCIQVEYLDLPITSTNEFQAQRRYIRSLPYFHSDNVLIQEDRDEISELENIDRTEMGTRDRPTQITAAQ